MSSATDPHAGNTRKEYAFDDGLVKTLSKSAKVKIDPASLIATQHRVCSTIELPSLKGNKMAISYCGKFIGKKSSAKDKIRIKTSSNGKMRITGSLQRCNNPSCYWCAEKCASKKATEIEKTLNEASREGYDAVFLSLTHQKHISTKKNYDATMLGVKYLNLYIRNHNNGAARS